MQIAGRKIGIDQPPLVIAEVGINHGGSLDVALKMVDAAADAGAEVVKFQIHHATDEMSDEARAIVPVNADKSIMEIMEDCSLSDEEFYRVKQHCDDRGVIFLATAFSRSAACFLKEINAPCIKVGSGECNHYPLISYLADTGIPLIISTGMNSFESIDRTRKIVSDAGVEHALLHCVNRYPTEPQWVRLGAITEMRARYDCPIGFSDHSIGSEIALASVALGACILERHFTDAMDRQGPDIACSMDPAELKWLITQSRNVWLASGGHKGPHDEEKVTSDFAFASLVADQDIQAGEMLTRSNLWARRPGNGILVTSYYDYVDRFRANQDIPRGTQLKPEWLEKA
ncbi:UNVERIFIED_ORG: N-acetylneuraminate synthase [Shinella zoogloeoides]|jgi:N-acetylneuraminate synthase|nr:N-acetylneuraminate synthase [Shinella zoogloeoides]